MNAQRFSRKVGLARVARGALPRAARRHLRQQRQRDQKQPATKGQRKKQRVEHPDHRQKQRRPGHVEQSQQNGRGEKALHRLEISQAGCGPSGVAGLLAGVKLGGKNPRIEPRLKAGTNPPGNAPARMFKQAHNDEQRRHQRKQGRKGCFRPAAKHTVIDLQHEERARQHQDIDEQAEHPDRPEPAACMAHDAAQLLCALLIGPAFAHPPLLWFRLYGPIHPVLAIIGAAFSARSCNISTKFICEGLTPPRMQYI